MIITSVVAFLSHQTLFSLPRIVPIILLQTLMKNTKPLMESRLEKQILAMKG